jgi:hypothetical protein
MRSRRGIHCLLALVLCAAVPAGAAQASHTPRGSACQRLAAHNRDASPDRRLVLVTRGDSESGRIYGCVLPRGKVRRLASWDDGLGRDSYFVVATAGTWVLVANAYGDQYGNVSRSLARIDVRSGRSVTLTGFGCSTSFGQSCATGTDFGRAVVARNGAGALELTDLADGRRSLQAFDSIGRLARLDDAPVQALAVRGQEVVWTREGVEHRAPLPG